METESAISIGSGSSVSISDADSTGVSFDTLQGREAITGELPVFASPATQNASSTLSSTNVGRSPEVRRIRMTAWTNAKIAATRMSSAALVQDRMDLFLAADDLDRTLATLWEEREGRDLNWQSILNHMQGVMRELFARRSAELMNADQCKAIVHIVEDFLGPASRTSADLTEAIRLIDDAGFDAFAALSGDED